MCENDKNLNDEEIKETSLEESTEEKQEELEKNTETVGETTNDETTPIDEEAKEIDKQKLKKNYIKIFIQLILTSLVYFIASAFDKFEGITSYSNAIHIEVLEYGKYIMYATYVLTIIAIVIFILKLCKKEIKIKVNLIKLYNVLDWVLLLPICIALATFCFSFLFTFTTVSGDSMNPNIYENDRLFVTYPSKYERFDVVVVKVNPSYQSVAEVDLYLKRIIGMPGEYIDYRLENGITQLYVNGQKVTEDFYTEEELREFLTYNTSTSKIPFEWSEKCFIDGGNSPSKPCEQVNGQYIIPEGYYFVLGDNRPASKDSRNIGLVKEKDIIGVTEYIVNNIFQPINID